MYPFQLLRQPWGQAPGATSGANDLEASSDSTGKACGKTTSGKRVFAILAFIAISAIMTVMTVMTRINWINCYNISK
jgi:hypothetical protein